MPHRRRDERAEFKARLAGGASLLMLAPRRIGKTWLLKRLAEDLTAEGWLCIHIDVEGKQSEDGFLKELCAEIEKQQGLGQRLVSHFKQRFQQASTDAKGGNLAELIGTIDARSFLETLVESLNAEPRETVILVDEIALFILDRARQDPDGTRALLYHLRKLQQKYTRVRWFLTGSIGLDVVARRHGMHGALLDYDNVVLQPFTADAARSYIDELCDGRLVPHPFDIDDAVHAHFVDELGWLAPYYLRQVALQIKPSGPARNGSSRATATIEDIDKAIAKLLTPAFQNRFAAWEEHIVKNFETAETALLHAILDFACATPNGDLEASFLARLNSTGRQVNTRQLKDLLINLANDGYLSRHADRWAFHSGLLRRYWLEYVSQ